MFAHPANPANPASLSFAPAREARTGIRQRRSATVGLPPEQIPEHLHAARSEDPHKPGDHKPDDKPDDAPTQQAKAAPKLILSSEEFTRGFVPPDYLWDGILLRGFVYSLGARTGDSKTAVRLCFQITGRAS